MLIREQTVITQTLQFKPKSLVLSPLLIKAMSFSLDGKGLTASGCTGRYYWLVSTHWRCRQPLWNGVGSWSLAWVLNPSTGSYLLPVANSKMSSASFCPSFLFDFHLKVIKSFLGLHMPIKNLPVHCLLSKGSHTPLQLLLQISLLLLFNLFNQWG